MDNLTQSTFRQRCASALTHPVTAGALGVLLLNDLVLKQLWANPWTTGKLSDLAWVVFASPLLAWLLSLVARENRRGQRAAWIAAYIGLPLLYAAFNTFPAVHDAVLSGFSLVSGGTAGSPLDPTDSLVIPVGLAVSWWVWRRGNAGAGVLRQRLVLLTAGVAVVASVASTIVEPFHGVMQVWSAEQGIVAISGRNEASYVSASGNQYYESQDGGLTWYVTDDVRAETTTGNSRRVQTPAGWYSIHGTELVLAGLDGRSKVVYSADFLGGRANRWLQEQSLGRSLQQRVPHRMSGITYDADSGNVIVAAGLSGVVVGTPNGEWQRVDVGSTVPLQPVELSPVDKVELLLSNRGFWTVALSLSIAVIALAIALAGALAAAAGQGTIGEGSTGFRIGLVLVLTVLAGFIAAIFLLTFGASAVPSSTMVWLLRVAAMALVAYSGAMTLSTFRSQSDHWPSILIAFMSVNALVLVAFVAWVQWNFSLFYARSGVGVTVILITVLLLRHLHSKQPFRRTRKPPISG